MNKQKSHGAVHGKRIFFFFFFFLIWANENNVQLTQSKCVISYLRLKIQSSKF